MAAFLNHLKRWWATHLTWIAAVAGFLNPSVQVWITHHPAYAIAAGWAWAQFLHLLKSPVGPPIGPPPVQ